MEVGLLLLDTFYTYLLLASKLLSRVTCSGLREVAASTRGSEQDADAGAHILHPELRAVRTRHRQPTHGELDSEGQTVWLPESGAGMLTDFYWTGRWKC